jgi:uncharacterized membrane protein YphA (DoxX/SURF4 family)
VSALTAVGLVVAALLAVAGAQKVLEPTMTVGALRAMGLPSSPLLVRLGAAAELAVGALAISVGTAVVWAAVALSYLLFTAFVVAALRRGSMIGSCGCFGREDTPPHWSHLVLNLVLAGGAASVALHAPASVVGELSEEPLSMLLLLPLGALAVLLLHAAYVDLPRALIAGRRVRGAG